jgi:hypothetical protein
MRNQAPIILNCFSRGGSNILWNMYLTHPEVCSPIRETLEIFRLNLRAPRIEGYLAVLLLGQFNFFNQWNLKTRRPPPKRGQNFIDRTLFDWKRKTFTDPEMCFKDEIKKYTLEEVDLARLVIKNNNGLTFLSDVFAGMYPEAVFIGLTREPLALYESHKRRKTPVSRSVADFTQYYREMGEKMLADSEQKTNAHIVRFEDLLAKPVQMMEQLYKWARLDMTKIEKVRFKAKPHVQKDGSHQTPFQEGQHYWFTFEEMRSFLEPNVNRYQVSQLTRQEMDQLLTETSDIREKLGYPKETSHA